MNLKLIKKEMKGCFDYFYNESNHDIEKPLVYGLTKDKTQNKSIASIASTGFSLVAMMIGCKNNFISFEEGYIRVLKTLEMALYLPHKHGFLPHFIDMESGKNLNSEFSTIDTAIFLMGAITACSYFKKETSNLLKKLYKRIEWDKFIDENNNQFIMAYFEKTGYTKARWDHYAEQLMLYILYAGNKKNKKEKVLALFNGFKRYEGEYKNIKVINCYSNPLFIHQFTHCFFDFNQYLDCNGVDWHENSRKATICNRLYCLEKKEEFDTYNESSWGLTAFQGIEEYKVYGAPPFGFPNNEYKQDLDGSVAPYASLSSIVFTPDLSLDALNYFNNFKDDCLNGIYGLFDSYRINNNVLEISKCYVGIDKGPTLIMLDNYLNKNTWNYFMNSKICKIAIKKLNFIKK